MFCYIRLKSYLYGVPRWLGRYSDNILDWTSEKSQSGSWHGQDIRRVQLKCDSARWRTGEEAKRKLANGVGSQYPSHYHGIWCIQHYYRLCAHLGRQ